MEVYKRRIHCFIFCNWIWKFIRDVYTVSYFVTGCGSLLKTYTLFHTLYLDVEVHKRRIHCFILRNWIWKFVKDVYPVSYFATGYGSL